MLRVLPRRGLFSTGHVLPSAVTRTHSPSTHTIIQRAEISTTSDDRRHPTPTASSLFKQPTIRQVLDGYHQSTTTTTPISTTPITSTTPSSRTTVAGWIRTKRKGKTVLFLELCDGSTHKGLQCILDPREATVVDLQPRLTVGASVRLRGELVKSLGSQQAVELQVNHVQLIGDCPVEVCPNQPTERSQPAGRLGVVPLTPSLTIRPSVRTFT